MSFRILICVVALSALATSQRTAERGQAKPISNQLQTEEKEKQCPKNWFSYKSSCYKFIRSPVKTREQARAQCMVGSMDL